VVPVTRKPSIAIVGTRGVPPRYGGFETFAAELGQRLAARGHDVVVYCRRGLYPDEPPVWQGIRRVELPAIRHKYLETVSHAFLSTLHLLRRRTDVVLLCNAANAFVLPLLASARIPVAINVDGIERMRKKWNWLGRVVYQVGESFSARFADAVVADAEVIAAYYRSTFAIEPQLIAYGSEFPDEEDSGILRRLGLSPRGFLLYVSRLEPENNPLAVRDAYARVRSDLPLVMVGDAPYSSELVSELRAKSDRRVILPGAIYERDYRTLQRNALLFIQATEVGGTHPALIEAMGSGGAVLANDTPENREAGGDAVCYFRLGEGQTLSELLQWAVNNPDALESYRSRARTRARERYSWPAVTDAYVRLFLQLQK
jgi:glycosyltransferase involved in cell wall biosynthesis